MPRLDRPGSVPRPRPKGLGLPAVLALALAAAAPAATPTAKAVSSTLQETPRQDTEIRRRLRGLRFIRNQMLERAIGKRFALGGHLALLLYDTPEELGEIALLTLSYDKLVRELLTFTIDDYNQDPGANSALERAISWGLDHALAVPHYHKRGYFRIVRVLADREDLRPGTTAPEAPISADGYRP